MQDTGRLVVCTENGEIMVCETSGEYMAFVHDSPKDNFKIECIVPYSRGFLIGGENGCIFAYERVEDSKNPYRRIKYMEAKIDQSQSIYIQSLPITSMVLTSTEDMLYFISENN